MRNYNLLYKLKEQPQWLLLKKRSCFTAIYLVVISLAVALCLTGCAFAV